jgi:hypothetical protein
VWEFAEGEVDRSRNLDTYVLIANTSEATAFVSVTLTFEDGTGANRGIEVAARSRENVSIAGMFPEAAGRRFAATVWSHSAWDQPPAQIVVEHATYWDAGGQPWAAGASALARRKP